MMYPNLYRELGLKKDDLSKYDMPLMGFDGRMDPIRTDFASRKHGGQGDNDNIHSGRLVFSIHSNSWKAMDSHNGDGTVHPTCEGQVPHRVRHCRCKR